MVDKHNIEHKCRIGYKQRSDWWQAYCLLVLGLLLLMGCNSSGRLQMDHPKAEGIYPGTAVALVMFAPPDQVSQRAAAQLAAYLQTNLSMKTSFGSVVSPEQAASYELRLTLRQVKEISEARRIFLNVIAGPTVLQGEVVLLRRVDSYPITRFQITSESATAPFVTGNDMGGAVEAFAKQVLQGLR